MGTTIVSTLVSGDKIYVGHVGDSRVYRVRDNGITQLTRDHSLLEDYKEAKPDMSEDEQRNFPHKNVITRALGMRETVLVDLVTDETRHGDVYLLCSDGLSGMVRNEEIREVLRTIDDPLEVCKTLTDRANQAGGHDNITVVVSKFEGEGLEDPTDEDIAGLRYKKYQLPEPIASSPMTAPDPSRRVKELDHPKVSVPLTPMHAQVSPEGSSRPSEGERREDGGKERPEPPLSLMPRSLGGGDEPIHIPTDGAPQWLIVMMIASALACITIAGYYLLR